MTRSLTSQNRPLRVDSMRSRAPSTNSGGAAAMPSTRMLLTSVASEAMAQKASLTTALNKPLRPIGRAVGSSSERLRTRSSESAILARPDASDMKASGRWRAMPCRTKPAGQRMRSTRLASVSTTTRLLLSAYTGPTQALRMGAASMTSVPPTMADMARVRRVPAMYTARSRVRSS